MPALVVDRAGRVPRAEPRGRGDVRTGEAPLSLPSDHMMIDGWFLSRWAMRVMRSSIGRRPASGPW